MSCNTPCPTTKTFRGKVAPLMLAFGLGGWSLANPFETLAAQPAVPSRAHAAPNAPGELLPSGDSATGLVESVVCGPSATPAFSSLPLYFEEAGGGPGSPTRFQARGSGGLLSISATEAWLARRGPVTAALRVRLVGGNPEAPVRGREALPGRVNYLTGDGSRWRTELPVYRAVEARQVYPGIDLVYYGNQRQLEFDFIVAPDANPNQIELALDGADGVEVSAQGELVLHTPAGEVRYHKPVIYQVVEGQRHEVPGGYVLVTDLAAAALGLPASRVRFEVAGYDASQPLVIDPVLTFSTALGGANADTAWEVAVDQAGNILVAGTTFSTDFPVAAAFQNEFAGGSLDGDIFVLKLNPAGDQLIYSTYLGGSGDDVAFALAVDAAGNAYVTGLTTSTNFPTVNAFQPAISGQPPLGLDIHPFDAVVAKLNPAGSALVYSTYLGGGGDDQGIDLAVDAAGRAVITGRTTSTNFPTVRALAGQLAGGTDAFVARFSPEGAALEFSTYLGGRGDDFGEGVAVDASGNVYVAGITSSTDFPQRGGVQTRFNGGVYDAFVTKLNAAGDDLVYSTFLGGAGDDEAFRLALDPVNNAYVTGLTDSANFPTAGAAQPTRGGKSDAFVAKLDPSGGALVYSTYLGGAEVDEGWDIALDAQGRAWVAGRTSSADFPVTPDAVQPSPGGASDAFVATLSADGATVNFATYLGGDSEDRAHALALAGPESVVIAGQTTSTNFPTLAPLKAPSTDGVADAFVARLGVAARLSVTRVGDRVQISWPATLGDVVLEAAVSLTPPVNWVEVSVPPVAEDGLRTVTLELGAGQRFFRLRQP